MARARATSGSVGAASGGVGHALDLTASGLDPTAELLRSVLDSTADGILVVDRAGKIVTYNRRFADMWRLPDEVLASREDGRALSYAMRLLVDPDAFVAKVQQLYGQPEAESYDVLWLRDGRIFERYSQPHRLGGAIQGRVWSFRDVTQHRRTEEKLRVSERYFRLLTEHARDLVAILGEDGTMRYASPSHETVLGVRPDDLVGADVRSFIHPDDLERATSLFAQALSATGVMPANEFRFRHANGSWRTLESIGINLLHEPDIAGIVVNSRDVTERKRAEQRTETLLAVASDIVGTLDLRQMLSRVQQRMTDAVPCDAVGVLYEEGESGELRVMSHHGFPPELAASVDALEFPTATLPFAERSARGETVVVGDFDTRAWLPAAMHPLAGTSSMIVAPFNVWNRHFGLLVAMNFGRDRAFDDGQTELVAGIASQVALAIEAVELFRTQREEADVAGALARVGRELISNVNHPQFLDRLCQTSAEVLRCDVASTMLERPDEGGYVPIAAYGSTSEEHQLARSLKVPYEMMASLVRQLAREDVVVVTRIPESILSSAQQRKYGVAGALCMALRRGSDLIGIQIAYRRGGTVFTMAERRIARGLAQIASLALNHANLIDELERANRVRSEFVATVSHELRTPLNIILGYGDLLLTGTFGALNEEQRETLQRMDRRARELLDVVNSTLEVSRLERGKVPLDVRETSLRELIANVEVETRELQERSGVPLRVELEDGDLVLRTDGAKLKVVLRNLVVNALKFTEHGNVTVRAAARGERVAIDVIDTGIGIPQASLPVIFEAFRQGHDTTLQTHGGVGLGLFIVARFVELLRGSVTVESEVGCGSTFRVDLPLRM
jgi:PAS domain S-box-containing protein